jgi:hypothetical protein
LGGVAQARAEPAAMGKIRAEAMMVPDAKFFNVFILVGYSCLLARIENLSTSTT